MSQLSEFDYVIVVDTSGSMGEPNKRGSTKTRWEAMQETATTLAREVEAFDDNSLGMVFFGGPTIQSHDGVTSQKLRELFAAKSPRGTTPLTEALQEALKLAGKSDKKDFIIVLTDGEPNDRESVVKVICDQAKAQANDEDLTILFVQVGDDAAATKFLEYLEDGLQEKFKLPHDIVDVKTVDQVDAFPDAAAMILAAIQG